MSKQFLLLALTCFAFQASSAMDKKHVDKQPENRFFQFLNNVRAQGAEQQQDWLKGYHSHLQQKPTPSVNIANQSQKDTSSSK